MASLDAALGSVSQLEALDLPDEQPNIEAATLSIVYDVSFDSNFEDRTAFVTGVAKYNEEATVQASLNEILEEGEKHASVIYTWRSCSRAVPTVKSDDQENRNEIYERTVEVLEPEVLKLKDFHRFSESAIDRFVDEVKRLAHENKRKDFLSETYLLTLGKLMNMFAVLDALKNSKAGINNDLSFFRRADGYLKRGSHDAAMLVELQNLSLFFGTQNKVTSLLKEKLEPVLAFEEVIGDTVNMCLQLFENDIYLLPHEKHMLLKAVGYGLVLIDGGKSNIYKLDTKKKINIAHIDRAFKTLPVVPLYGDLQIAICSYIKQSRHYDSSRWTCVTDAAEEKVTMMQYNLVAKMDMVRAEHEQYSSELARFSNEVATLAPTTRTDTQNRELTDLALRGLQRLSSWTAHLTEMFSWKLLHPTDKYLNRECPDDAEEYERVIRYNFSSAEKFAFVEVIAMIKGLMSLMLRMEMVFSEAIRRSIHSEMQEFIQVTLRDPLRRAVKHKKQMVRTVLMAIRETCVDWAKGVEPRDDPCLKGEKDPKSGFHADLPRRRVGPSSTQLYMIRTMVESLISEKGGRKVLRQDLNQRDIPGLEAFVRRSFFYKHLLDFSRVLRECCDLSQLWFREFHLELTMGKRIQFPIEMSLPWILTDHILETKEPAMMEYVLFPLDLYSDSAHYALHKFKKQYLYDEVEAEVNLCFDQFVYKVSEQVFVYFKTQACSVLLDKRFRAHCASGPESVKVPYPQCNRYSTILKQRHVQILGRSVDLNRLIAQRVNAALHKALDLAIARFESGDLTGIVELDTLIETNRLTHEMLSEYLTLDPFDSMLKEANQAVSSPHGRITLHCFWELNQDFLPNFVYNSSTNRFVRARMSFADVKESQREPPPKAHHYYWYGNKQLNLAYSSYCQLYGHFIGEPHFIAMTRMLGYQGIAMVIEELLKVMDGSLNGTIKSYVHALMEGMPKKCKLPLADYGSPGVLGFYHLNLNPILQYSNLKTEVFQAFKEIGNGIIFCLLMEQCLSQEEVLDLLQAAPFQGVYPRPFVKEGQNADVVRQQVIRQYAALQVIPVIEQLGTPTQIETAKEGHLLTKERLCRGLSMFEVVLHRIQSFLHAEVWSGPPPANGVMNVEECTEFYRLWSAIQFVYCVPPFSQAELTVEECFGEGLQWAGCTLIMLLNQQRRFEAFDFCYHIVKVQENDGKDETVQGVPLKRLVERVRQYQRLNRQIFALLNKHLHSRPTLDAAENIRYFQPPIHENFVSTV